MAWRQRRTADISGPWGTAFNVSYVVVAGIHLHPWPIAAHRSPPVL